MSIKRVDPATGAIVFELTEEEKEINELKKRVAKLELVERKRASESTQRTATEETETSEAAL